MTNNREHWSEDERVLLVAILDQLIPANEEKKIPSAGDPGTALYLAGIAAGDDQIGTLFARGLKRAAELSNTTGGAFVSLNNSEQIAVIRQLEEAEPAFFEALLRHTYMAYYSRPDIRALLGLLAKPTQPDGYDVPSETPEFMAELTAPVRRRGQVYRAC
ncbi:MAG: gluconate 2-dehydrogenase subunit 3 family protein [Hyphomicrobiales bacterium]|nr:gluconate 2-dehydrogenase subunit 3 family protein [Hyphomicrobiales bacterium]MCP5001526.1 gluconate 2-dehydrogenase subunit 3 family protein [Hyphomicrobiales bacterium]